MLSIRQSCPIQHLNRLPAPSRGKVMFANDPPTYLHRAQHRNHKNIRSVRAHLPSNSTIHKYHADMPSDSKQLECLDSSHTPRFQIFNLWSCSGGGNQRTDLMHVPISFIFELFHFLCPKPILPIPMLSQATKQANLTSHDCKSAYSSKIQPIQWYSLSTSWQDVPVTFR